MTTRRECPECGGRDVFEHHKEVGAGGGHGPELLPGLGTTWRGPRMRIVTCGDCGLVRFFAADEARKRLGESPKWRRL